MDKFSFDTPLFDVSVYLLPCCYVTSLTLVGQKVKFIYNYFLEKATTLAVSMPSAIIAKRFARQSIQTA